MPGSNIFTSRDDRDASRGWMSERGSWKGAGRTATSNIIGSPAGGDTYWSNVVLLAGNDNAADGTNTFVDQSAAAHTLSIGTGLPVYASAQKPTGMSTSIAFPATARIQSADSADWAFGAGDFTLEAYIRWNGAPGAGCFMSQWDTSTSFIFDWNGTSLRLVTSDSGGTQQNVTSVWSPSANTWYHVAAVRGSNTGRIFVDGTQLNSGTISQTLRDSSEILELGSINKTAEPMNGWMCSLRITKGVARYTSNFTPPTLPLPTS